MVFFLTCEQTEDCTEIQTLACMLLIKVHLLMVCLRQTDAEDLHFTVTQQTFSLKTISNSTKHKHYFKGNGVFFCKGEVNNSERVQMSDCPDARIEIVF